MAARRYAALLLMGFALLHSAPADAGGRKQAAPDARILRGSRSALARENAVADRHGLTRIRDLAELRRFIDRGLLVPVRPTDAYDIDPELGENDPGNAALYAHARPWTKAFLDEVLAEGHRLHGDRFLITSLTRTQAYQRVLRRHNATAASGRTPAERSSHLTGATVDIRSTTLSLEGLRWFRRRLAELERRGAIQATEERHNGCFHIMVFPDYERRAHPAPPRSRGKRR